MHSTKLVAAATLMLASACGGPPEPTRSDGSKITDQGLFVDASRAVFDQTGIEPNKVCCVIRQPPGIHCVAVAVFMPAPPPLLDLTAVFRDGELLEVYMGSDASDQLDNDQSDCIGPGPTPTPLASWLATQPG